MSNVLSELCSSRLEKKKLTVAKTYQTNIVRIYTKPNLPRESKLLLCCSDFLTTAKAKNNKIVIFVVFCRQTINM